MDGAEPSCKNVIILLWPEPTRHRSLFRRLWSAHSQVRQVPATADPSKDATDVIYQVTMELNVNAPWAKFAIPVDWKVILR